MSHTDTVVRICPDRDRECGDFPRNWCDTCPKRAAIQPAGDVGVLLSPDVLRAAAKAVESSATVWTGFAMLDAKTCIQAALQAVAPPVQAAPDAEELAADLKTARATIRVMDQGKALLLARIAELEAVQAAPVGEPKYEVFFNGAWKPATEDAYACMTEKNRRIAPEVKQDASALLIAENQKLRGLILKALDRWWPFVHGTVGASNTAKNLFKELSDGIQPCTHEWPENEAGPNPNGACKKCGITFLQYANTPQGSNPIISKDTQ